MSKPENKDNKIEVEKYHGHQLMSIDGDNTINTMNLFSF